MKDKKGNELQGEMRAKVVSEKQAKSIRERERERQRQKTGGNER